jgi:hypothetical protein
MTIYAATACVASSNFLSILSANPSFEIFWLLQQRARITLVFY